MREHTFDPLNPNNPVKVLICKKGLTHNDGCCHKDEGVIGIVTKERGGLCDTKHRIGDARIYLRPPMPSEFDNKEQTKIFYFDNDIPRQSSFRDWTKL
jgi:hypothetical protein